MGRRWVMYFLDEDDLEDNMMYGDMNGSVNVIGSDNVFYIVLEFI